MVWGIIVVGIIFAVVGYIVIQGTRAAMAWRRAAASGDVEVIRQLLEDTIESWRSMKRPKEIAPEVWRDVQSVALVDAGPDNARVSCEVGSEYRMLDGRWVEIAGPLQQALAVTARLADMLLYEVPHLRLASARIDVYTTFREADGPTQRACILTTDATREAAREVDWEEWPAIEIVEAFGGRYRMDDRGGALPLELEEEAPAATLSPHGLAEV